MKKAKVRRRRWYLWRRVAHYYVHQLTAKTKAKVRRAVGPREVARASSDWIGGENLRPVVQPMHLDRYVAPEDLASFEASLGGYRFTWEMLPDPTADLRAMAYEFAERDFGAFAHSLVLDYIAPTNDLACTLTAPITE